MRHAVFEGDGVGHRMRQRRLGVGKRQPGDHRRPGHPRAQFQITQIFGKRRQGFQDAAGRRYGKRRGDRIGIDVPKALQRMRQGIQAGADGQFLRRAQHQFRIDEGMLGIEPGQVQGVLLLGVGVPDRGPAGDFAAGPRRGRHRDYGNAGKLFLSLPGLQEFPHRREVTAGCRQHLCRVDHRPAADGDDHMDRAFRFPEKPATFAEHVKVRVLGDVVDDGAGRPCRCLDPVGEGPKDRFIVGHQGIITAAHEFGYGRERAASKDDVDRIPISPHGCFSVADCGNGGRGLHPRQRKSINVSCRRGSPRTGWRRAQSRANSSLESLGAISSFIIRLGALAT